MLVHNFNDFMMLHCRTNAVYQTHRQTDCEKHIAAGLDIKECKHMIYCHSALKFTKAASLIVAVIQN